VKNLTRVRNSKARNERTTVVGDEEFERILDEARKIKKEFFRLRTLALMCVLRLTGKRRGEVASVKLIEAKTENNFLNLTFTLEKKRKGHVSTKQALKSIPLSDPLTKPILEWIDYLHMLEPVPKFLFPPVKSVFGVSYMVLFEDHICGKQVFNLVRSVTEEVWPHLFRETVASDVIKKDSSIFGAFKVMRRLDLEDYRTGFRYLKRFAADIIKREKESDEGEQIIIRK